MAAREDPGLEGRAGGEGLDDEEVGVLVDQAGALRGLLADAAPKLRLVFVIGRNLEDLSYLAGPLFKTMPSSHVSLLLREEAEALAPNAPTLS